mmetsp:Transcript_26915/g.43268  ORF Transcript_26915/g.43268 Transcript_26915/m.43268 type:complete len:364 (+) Transcript_26915:1636-2727(+)
MVRDEAAPGGPVLGPPRQNGAGEVVRLGPHVEHEEQRAPGDEHVQHLADRLPAAALQPDRADDRQREQYPHRSDPVADGVDADERLGERQVEGSDEDALVAEGVQPPHREQGRDVEADAAVEERHQLEEVHGAAYAVHVPREALHRVPAAELPLKLVELLEADVTALAALDVLLKGDVPAAQHRVKPGEDVLGEVDPLGRLRNPAPRHVEELVKEVGVAVVQPDLERIVEHALPEGDEAALLHGHVVGDGAQAAGEDVLPEPDDRGRLAAVPLVKLLHQVPHLDRLLEVALLVHVDRLDELAAREDYGVVLVLGLTLPDDGVAGELNAVHGLDAAAALPVVAIIVPFVVSLGVLAGNGRGAAG